MSTVKFKVVCLATKEDATDDFDDTRIFDDGESAAKYAEYLTSETGTKWQPRRIVSDKNWRAREAKRFYDGTYYPVPWDTAPWWHGGKYDQNHFAHISVEQDVKIAYTPNEEMGLLDKQQRVAIGSYLTAFFRYSLDPEEIREWAVKASLQYEDLKMIVTQNPDEIEQVYNNGPNSCMSHRLGEYATKGIHPCKVYAGPDLALAYMTNSNDDGPKLCDNCREEGYSHCDDPDECPISAGKTYSARAVCWPEKKIYGRIYGDTHRLAALFQREGWKSGSMEGARIRRLPTKYGEHRAFVLPYIDGAKAVVDAGDYLVIDSNKGYIACGATNGVGIDNRPVCPKCNKTVKDIYSIMSSDGNRATLMCEECRGDGYIYCNLTGYYYARSDVIDFADWGVIPIHMLGEYVTVCSMTKEPLNRATEPYNTMADGSHVSRKWFSTQGKRCPTCGCGVPHNPSTKMVCRQTFVSRCGEHRSETPDPEQREPTPATYSGYTYSGYISATNIYDDAYAMSNQVLASPIPTSIPRRRR